MKKFISVLLILSLLLSLGACRKRKVEEQATEPTDSPTESTRATTQSAPTEPPTEEPTQEPEKPKEVLEVLQYGSLSGAFVEDGSDRAVENVACILVRNTTEAYLDYALIHAKIGETLGEFVLTGIPAGGTLWVMESNALTISAEDDFEYVDQTLSQLREEEMIDPRVQVEFCKGSVILTNVGTENLKSVKVYYKQLHRDGNYFGGITYTVSCSELPAGQCVTVLTGHSTEENSVLVRLTCEVDGSGN